MNTEDKSDEFVEWCKQNKFGKPEEYGNELLSSCGVRYNTSTHHVEGTLGDIHFKGVPRFKGNKMEVNNSEWVNTDTEENGEGSLTVALTTSAPRNSGPSELTVRGYE